MQELAEVNRDNRLMVCGHGKMRGNWKRQHHHMILFGRSIFVAANNTGVKTLASRLVTRFAEGILGVGHMTAGC